MKAAEIHHQQGICFRDVLPESIRCLDTATEIQCRTSSTGHCALMRNRKYAHGPTPVKTTNDLF